MVYNDAVVESLVAIMEVLKEDVLLDWRGLRAQPGEDALFLGLHRKASGGDEAANSDAITFTMFETGSLIEQGVVESINSHFEGTQRSAKLLECVEVKIVVRRGEHSAEKEGVGAERGGV